MSIEGWIQRWKVAQVFFEWQTLIAGVLALAAAAFAYRAAIMQVKVTARAADDQIKALRAQEEREAENVREAVQIEITSMVVGVIEVANLLGRLRKEGKVPNPRSQDMIARALVAPTIYPGVSDRVGLLRDPYPVVIFYSKLAEARSIISSSWNEEVRPAPDFVGQTLACFQTVLLLARPIVAGELFGGQRLDLVRRQHTTSEIDTCLRDILGSIISRRHKQACVPAHPQNPPLLAVAPKTTRS